MTATALDPAGNTPAEPGEAKPAAPQQAVPVAGPQDERDDLLRLTPIGVQLRARIRQFAGSGATLIGVLALMEGWQWESRRFGRQMPADLTTALRAVTVLVLVVLLLRLLALIALTLGNTRPLVRRTKPQLDSVAGELIVCSGGGIKSAAFCLGGLQRLDHDGRYEHAKAIIGVSGGSYIAAAYATLRYRRGPGFRDGRPFEPGGDEEAALRTRSNYLASSRLVRFSLLASFAYGILVNLAIGWAAARALSWLVAQHVGIVAMLGNARGGAQFSPIGRSWVFNPGGHKVSIGWGPLTTEVSLPLALPTVALLCGMAVFILGRGADPLRRRVAAYRTVEKSARRNEPLDALATIMDRLPAALVGLALVYTLLVVGLPWFIANWPSLRLPSISENQGKILTAVLAAVVALVTQTVRDGAAPTGTDREPPWIQVVLRRVRRVLVPALGVLLVALTFLLLMSVMVNDLLSAPRMPGLDYLLAPLVIVLVIRVGVAADRTSLFPFYRRQLGWGYLQVPPGGKSPSVLRWENQAGFSGNEVPLKSMPTLTDLKWSDKDRAPTLVLCATVSMNDVAMVPAGRGATPIVLGEQVGFTDARLPGGSRLLAVEDYDRFGGGSLSIDEAVAMSGAAISPLAGRQGKQLGPSRLLLALANIRLGVWIRSPYWTPSAAERLPGWWRRPIAGANWLLDNASGLQVVREALGSPSIYDQYVYVTDGGHYDNLGLVEALRRRPSSIFMMDGSGDTEDEFPAMGDAIATARMDLGVEVSFDPAPMRRDMTARRAWTLATARYPDGHRCRIVYVKAVLAGELPWDVQAYRLRHPGFPSWANELEVYDEFDFEAYRQLGWNLVGQAIDAVQ
ncbi:MAG TPA: hypothetical protein VFJ97_02255 [Dermatophilaceae bacterium]|nr:hypothetical protein [Dermatophilaceae bacterium]